ncbi:SDR family oxidoreductase [Mucilaginibacter polytrichastri]|uniref:Vi polysaccharide biosynthesis protein vipB/tviC n=1 Tax=Mucilaginibacter polytrichastri TaxID=1302689 RepID=A0A1Q5ZZ27_9SPHI|nr:SDR family oxidoreductase [Mucilaginibacter polytrichastri]OKS87020.1 Vi polysaccharide biosynthesis protein vipB/tviC [Mucilaginibacter polytrichastri]SFS86035.1 UDP-N-acetylglucosamine 4-epimerase [Mucilaginibacter polytrichastri]
MNLYNSKYHLQDISANTFLVTGGAGFIGSNLVQYLITHGAGHVKVLDNLSNGYYSNIEEYEGLGNFEFIKGDIRDLETCKAALAGVDYVSHQAALGSVPRSITDPITTNDVNISGFLNMLTAVKDTPSVKRMVYAASSSTYGDSKALPKVEGEEGKALSPYAVTKAVNEMYADVFSKVYGCHTIGLRYFNIFGPKQNPDNPYAAVIPIFCKSFIDGVQPVINGDGKTSRDFTFVANAVQANIKSMLFERLTGHEVFNVACGGQIDLNGVIDILKQITGKDISPIYRHERAGDVKHSLASIDKIRGAIGYECEYSFKQGLELVYEWYLSNNNQKVLS